MASGFSSLNTMLDFTMSVIFLYFQIIAFWLINKAWQGQLKSRKYMYNTSYITFCILRKKAFCFSYFSLLMVKIVFNIMIHQCRLITLILDDLESQCVAGRRELWRLCSNFCYFTQDHIQAQKLGFSLELITRRNRRKI